MCGGMYGECVELVKTHEFLAPYMYVLELMGDHERILALIRQEEITPDISDAIS